MTFRRRTALALSLGLALAAAARADGVDDLVRGYMRVHAVPGLALSILKDGAVVTRRCYGFANLETGTPVAPDSVFELASLTKPLTAAAVMTLVRDGRVGLDDALAKYVDGAPPEWSAITVRALLSHTAGLPELAEPEWDGSPLFDVTRKQQLEAIVKAPRAGAPGERGQYSDPGYFLLGMVIEKASGTTYAEFMDRAIFAPLGMTSTFVQDPSRIVKGRVAPYAVREGRLLRGRRDWNHQLPSHFGVWSTIEDLERLEAGLTAGRPLGRDALEAMWAPASLRDGRPALVNGGLYGFGWQVGDHRGRRAVEHGGFTGTEMLRFPDEGLTIVILSNLDLASGNAPAFLARMVAGAFDPALRPPHELAPADDPDPATTASHRDFLRRFGGPESLARMTAVQKDLYATQPEPVRKGMAELFSSLDALVYLGQDAAPVDKPFARLAQRVDRIRYYRAATSRGERFFSFYVDADGRIADMRSYPAAAVAVSGPPAARPVR